MMDGDTDKIGTLPKGSGGGVPTAELGLDKPSPPMEVEEDEVIQVQDVPGQLVVMGTTGNGAGEKLEQFVPLTGAELEAKVMGLEGIVEEQMESIGNLEKTNVHLKKSLERMEEETRKLKKRLKTAKQMFGNEWGSRKRQWKWQREELVELMKEEQLLLGMVQVLEKAVGLGSRGIWLKEEQVQTLTERAKELKYGKEKRVKVKGKGTTLKNSGKAKITEAVDDGIKDAAILLPEEVWKIVIGNVSDPKDLWSLYNTCQLFDNILSKWKTGWMLAQALPYIYKDLPSRKLLECRLVCKSWKGATDGFLETHPSVIPHNPEMIDPRRMDYVDPLKEKGLRGIEVTFCNPKYPSILEDPVIPNVPGQNPFVGRCVILNLSEYKPRANMEEEDTEKLIEKVFHFLTNFGSEIWYLTIWFPELEEEGLLHPRVVQFVAVDLFPLVPNLKELAMGAIVDDIDPVPSTEAFPPAPKLETLQAYYREELHDPLMMQRYSSQLRKLFTSAAATSFLGLCQLEWPNLRELHLVSIGHMSLLSGLDGTRMPQLSKLGLNLEAIQDGSSYDQLLAVIRQLSSTTRLNTIRLEGGAQRLKTGQDQFLWGHCAPSSIKTLEVDGNCNWVWDDDVENEAGTPRNYSFLLQYFPFVENVHVFWRKSHYPYDTEVGLLPQEELLELALKHGFMEVSGIVEVNKYAYRGQMYRSNIWELLPRLKVFSFQWDVYTRHGYEEYKEKTKKWVNNAN